MLYDDLLALPPSDDTPHADPKNTISQQKEDLAIINAADQRLIETQTTSFDSERLSKTLRSLQRWEKSSLHADALPETCSTDNSEVISVAPSSQPYHRVLTRVQNLMTRMETMKSSLLPHASVAGQEISSQPEKITISILSKQEWESLIRVCVSTVFLKVHCQPIILQWIDTRTRQRSCSVVPKSHESGHISGYGS